MRNKTAILAEDGRIYVKRWKKSKGIRSFLLVVLLLGIFLDVLAGMYRYIGKEYAEPEGKEGVDFFVSQEKTSQILDGYIRLFEEYMQIGNLITVNGDIDYDKEILVSLTNDKTYTIKELLRNSPSEGVGSGMLRDFMEEFSENSRKGISYPWKTRFVMNNETRVFIEGGRIFSLASPNAKVRNEKQIANMKKRLENMVATSTDDITFEEDFRDHISMHFSGKLSWKYEFNAKSVYEEYLITYFPSYVKSYFLDRVLTSYEEAGRDIFLEVYEDYKESKPEEVLSEKKFYYQLKKELEKQKEILPEQEIPWRVHSVPRTMEEARKYVTFLVETYQELKYLFSGCNFIYAYENSSNYINTNHSEDWKKIKVSAQSGKVLEKITDSSVVAFAYYNSRNDEGVTNLNESTLPMSGNVIEKIRNIGKNFLSSSYQIAVGIDLQGVMNATQEDEFVSGYQDMVQKRKLYHFGSLLAMIGGALTVISFLLLVLRCGSPVEEGEETESLSWFDRIWLEAQLLLGYLMIGMVLWVLKMWNGFLIQPMILLCGMAVTVLLYGCLRILLSLVKRKRLHCGSQYSMVLLFLKEVILKKTSLKTFLKEMSLRMAFIPTKRKFGFLFLTEIFLLAYYGISAAYVMIDKNETVLSYATSSLGVIGMVLGGIFLVTMFFWQRNAMNDQSAEYDIIFALRQITGGDFSYQLPEKDSMSLRVKELVGAVNQIGNVVEAAVEESIKSERMKTELIANVSHDIKTPLTSIINYVDLLQGENIPNERVQKYLAVLEKKSLRLKVLMEDLIEASKASSGVMELDIQPLGFSELIRQTNGEFEERFAENHLELVVEIPEEPMIFQGDGRRVFRILENLYSNTAKYAMEGTRVYVTLQREGEELIFTMKNVSATRLNITPEELTERFVRGDHARTTEGSGLGLSIAKSLTELMGGIFQITLDGDLFCVKIIFPEMTEEQ